MDKHDKFNRAIRGCMNIMADFVANDSDRDAFQGCVAVVSALIAEIMIKADITIATERDALLAAICTASKHAHNKALEQIKNNKGH
jgi:hypothetical protein